MLHSQQTISKPLSIAGIGIHSGKASTLTFCPAAENHGIVFQRVDLDGQPQIPALVDFVVDTQLGTTLFNGKAMVKTVEHVLAALTGLGIDNVLVQLDNEEPPICDGSSIEFVEILKKAGIVQQNALRNYLRITETLEFTNEAEQVWLRIEPAHTYSIAVEVDYSSPLVPPQSASMESLADFEDEIADSRTFCFLRDVIKMHSLGLVKGGTPHNAVVFVDSPVSEAERAQLKSLFKVEDIAIKDGFLNGMRLRHENEPARHKLLDMVGDLTLVGAPILGKITAKRPGHTANAAFSRLIRQTFMEKIRV